jgi:NADPH-dependent 2,4-dienoyl-CoA reductase/sulfur reductase-like enzyme
VIVLESGKAFEFDGPLLATGADPVRLPIEGATDSQLLVRAVEPSATTGAA